jgi:hypothetical protein
MQMSSSEARPLEKGQNLRHRSSRVASLGRRKVPARRRRGFADFVLVSAAVRAEDGASLPQCASGKQILC